MKRTNTVSVEKAKPGQIKFRKEGGGSFVATIDGRRKMVKPGEVFFAHPDEIPENFSDVIVPVNKSELEATKEPVSKAPVMGYYPKHHGGGKYNVYSSDDKKQNEDWLSKDEAKALVESLNKG